MKRVRRLSISALVFSLLLVAIGNYLSFHSDVEVVEKVHAAQLHIAQDSSHDGASENDHEHGFDPCEQGFCHLGHCAKLVFADGSIPEITFEIQNKYFHKLQAVQDLVLDGPYQPPKRA
jgi:hypothetical protein